MAKVIAVPASSWSILLRVSKPCHAQLSELLKRVSGTAAELLLVPACISSGSS